MSYQRSKMSWATCCGSNDLKKVDQKNLNDENMRQRIHDKLKILREDMDQ